jgi:hypothetical protein
MFKAQLSNSFQNFNIVQSLEWVTRDLDEQSYDDGDYSSSSWLGELLLDTEIKIIPSIPIITCCVNIWILSFYL